MLGTCDTHCLPAKTALAELRAEVFIISDGGAPAPWPLLGTEFSRLKDAGKRICVQWQSVSLACMRP